VASLVADTLELFEPIALNKGVEFRGDLPPELPAVEVDVQRIGRSYRTSSATLCAYTERRLGTIGAEIFANQLASS